MSEPLCSYATINRAFGPEEIKEKGSRFIAYIHPAAGVEEVNDILHSLRKKYHDASHVCYAYRLGEGVEMHIRYNDDGEPSGTAGVPIYNELKGHDYFNVLLAVVRYFGGTKLGTGGLARAYQQAARKVIYVSKVFIHEITRRLTLAYPFEFQGEMRKLMERFSISLIKESYSAAGVSMRVAVPTVHHQTFKQKITILGKGEISVKED